MVYFNLLTLILFLFGISSRIVH